MRRDYQAPVVTDYGTVSRLTQGMGGSGVDSLAMGARVASMSMAMNMGGSPIPANMYPWDLC